MVKKIIKLNERQLNKIVKRVLNESYIGIIKSGDDICEIICKRKLAQYGSTGNVVKMIQHLLDANGFNTDYEGGGMKAGCTKEYSVCDGLFKRHTRDAVKEFQRRYKLTVDGIVGYNTWKAMCDNLEFTISLPKEDFCEECQCNQQKGGTGRERDIPSPTDDSIVDELEIIDCEDLKYCVAKYLYQTNPNILAFYRCVSKKVGLTDEPPKDQTQGCTDSAGNNLCKMIPEPIPQGRMTTAVMGYYYDPSKGRCVSVSGGPAPFRQMDKCTECCERRKQ